MLLNKFQTAMIFAFLLFTFAVTSFAQSDALASRTWEVQKYDITATLPQSETDRYLNVKTVLNLKNVSRGSASRVTLRISNKAEIVDVKANGATANFSKSEEKVGGNITLQRAAVSLPAVQANQTASVEVNYKLKVDENSGLNALSPVGAQFLPLSFWYPTPNSWYFARGADFAPISLTVVAPNSANVNVVASGDGGDPTSSGRTSFSFNQKLNGQPFFITGNWDSINASGVSVYLPKGAGADEQKRANEIVSLVAEAKTFFTNLFGTAPATPLQIVSVRRGAGFSSGGTILVDASVFKRQKLDSQTAMTLAESIAKIWLENSVRVDGDGFGVVQEGLSRFVATQFLESKYGKDVADIERLRQRTAYAAVAKRDSPLTIVSPLDDYFYSEVANKGAMIWRLLAKKVGQEEFFNVLRSNMKDGNLSLSELRTAFSAEKNFLDHAFDKVTDMNLLVGLPQASGAETKVALRNTSAIDAAVNVVATTVSGEKLTAQTTIKAQSYGEVTFKTANRIVRVEIDSDKFYPQIDYFDDIAPREFEESDALLAIKRAFDKQKFAEADKYALSILKLMPRFDDARILLGRSLLAQGKMAEAEKEFRAVLDEKLPTARSLAWANEGLGEIALKANQNSQAAAFYNEAIKADGEYGATLAARRGLNKLSGNSTGDESIKAFFADFDKAAISGRKADVDALIVSGEIPKFSSGISGQAQEWQTKVLRVDKLDANNALAEVSLNIRLLSKEAESGTAVFQLTKVGNVWKLSGVEIFEVR